MVNKFIIEATDCYIAWEDTFMKSNRCFTNKPASLMISKAVQVDVLWKYSGSMSPKRAL